MEQSFEDFTVENGVLIKYKGTGGNVVIPDGVTAIGERAFEGCTALTSVEISESVNTIGKAAFYGSGLNKIRFVTPFGWSAESESGSTPFSSADLYNGATVAEYFTDPEWACRVEWKRNCLEYKIAKDGTACLCTGMGDCTQADIEIASVYEEKPVTAIGEWAFSKCRTLRSVAIPDSVKCIGEFAFSECKSLANVKIPPTVTEIGEFAFQKCTGLAGITIPDSVTKIGCWAFSECTSLAGITIPASVKSIGQGALACGNLVAVEVSPENRTYYSAGNCVVERATKIVVCGCKNSVIPSAVAKIGQDAFYQCGGITTITVPSGVVSIGNEAFCQCENLVSVTIPNTVTEIGKAAFKDCTSLIGITVPHGVTRIDDYTFDGCKRLAAVTVPDSLGCIGFCAFRGCDSLRSITLPARCAVGKNAFPESCTVQRK